MEEEEKEQEGQEPEGEQDDLEQGSDQGFSQADVDRIVQKRLERERARYADYDALKEAAEKLKALEEADLSEREKLEKRIAELEQAEAEAKSKAEVREMEVNEKLIRAEVRVVAAGMGFVNPEDAYGLADLADIALDDDGAVQGVKKALEKLAKEKPYLLDGKSDGGVGTPSRGKRTTTGKAPAELEPTKSIVRW